MADSTLLPDLTDSTDSGSYSGRQQVDYIELAGLKDSKDSPGCKCFSGHWQAAKQGLSDLLDSTGCAN